MADADKTLKILLQVQSEDADLQKVNGGLKDLQAQAAATGAEVAKIGSGDGGNGTVVLSEAAQGRLTIEERISSIITQRQILIDLEVEKLQAAAAGESERVAALASEIQLRQVSLQYQSTARLSEDEALVLARQRIVAETQIVAAQAAQGEASLVSGINLSRARGEALTLSRELATGSVNARTMGALLGSFGPILAVAGVAGYALFEAVSKLGQDWRDVDEQINVSSGELNVQIGIWDSLAGSATKFADAVSLGAKQVSELTRLTKQLADIQSKPIGTLDRIQDFASKIPDIIKNGLRSTQTILPGILAGLLKDDGPNAAAKAAETKRAQDELNRGLLTSVETQDKLNTSREAWNATLAEVPTQALTEYNNKLADAKTKLDALAANRATSTDAFKAWQDQQTVVGQLSDKVGTLKTRATEYGNAVKKSADQTRLLKDEASGDQQAVIADKVKSAYDEIYKSKLAAHVPDAEAKQLAQEQSQALGQQLQAQLNVKGATAGTKAEHQAISAELKEEQIHLQIIRGLMSAVANDPFASVFEKANAQLKLIQLSIKTIKRDLATQQGNISKGILDPQQLEQARQKLVQDNLELIKLGQTAKTLSIGGTLRADLVSWANQFGTTAHQIGQAITQSIGTAVSGVSNAITGAIFQTQSWGQAFAQVAQQIVGSIINIVVQWIAQQAVLLALHAVFGATTSATTSVLAAESAAAWAPAATAASIASYGTADTAGVAALAAAMGAGQGIVTGFSAAGGSFAAGGYTGDGPSNQPAGIVHRGEFVFPKSAVDRKGAAWFEGLQIAINRPGFERGGSVGGGSRSASPSRPPSGDNHFFFVSNHHEATMRALRTGPGKKMIIDIVNGAGGHLRT